MPGAALGLGFTNVPPCASSQRGGPVSSASRELLKGNALRSRWWQKPTARSKHSNGLLLSNHDRFRGTLPTCSADALATSAETFPPSDNSSSTPVVDDTLTPPTSSQSVTDSQASIDEDDADTTAATPAKKKSGALKRVLVGTILGLLGGFIIITGKKMYVSMICLVVYQVTQEYYGFITSKGISKGMKPPPRFVSIATTILCISITIFTSLYQGRSGTALAIAAFSLLSLNIILLRRPTFSQLASSLFGLFYCGYLPSFWVKLRMLSAVPLAPAFTLPAAVTQLVNWNVGLVATFTSVACIIAADTGAYFVGKNFGRTKLTEISPKKTVEGAVGGLVCSMGVATACSYLLGWPGQPIMAATLGVLIFFTSLFGDLIESIMKREAGLKDSGDLLPGHGGLLDRFDSYIFTGAVAYFFTTLT